jgi:hypothetical protein
MLREYEKVKETISVKDSARLNADVYENES